MFKIDGFELEFEQSALEYIAQKAFKLKTGARGIRTILENKMLDLMFDLPDPSVVQKIVITRGFIEKDEKPLFVERKPEKKEAV